MYRNQFKTGEAEPLRKRRISAPPIFRRLSGRNVAAIPTAKRRSVRRMAGEDTEVNPVAHPPSLPGNFPAISRKLAGPCRPFASAIPRTIERQFQRLSTIITGASAGLRAGSLPLYAQR